MKKYRTRSGREVNIWTFNSHQKYFPIRGEIQAPDGDWSPASWASDLLSSGSDVPSETDLVEVHPCADLKHGDAVMVWNCSRGSRKCERKFIGYTDAGAVYSADEDGLVTLWSFGEPA